MCGRADDPSQTDTCWDCGHPVDAHDLRAMDGCEGCEMCGRDQSPGAVLRRIAAILWEHGDPDFEWDSETIEHVASVMEQAGYRPVKEIA